ncbi:MAG: hypothetical protein E7591_00500 [Ruminococcaceae bacterium]|nr:hypothetical protein [Oscillospiraceae bacterium]
MRILFSNKTRVIGLLACVLVTSILILVCEIPLNNSRQNDLLKDKSETALAEPESDPAIIILPGIMGSELEADEDHSTFYGGNIEKGDTVWMPDTVSDALESVKDLDTSFISDITLSDISDLIACFKFISTNEKGESINKILPKAVTKNDKQIGTLGSYTELYNTLYKKYSDSYDVIFFSYDWRMSSRDNAKLLDAFIKDKGFTDVTFVCHSMGGIVAAQYLTLSADSAALTERVITIGTPYGGSPKALMVLQDGRYFNFGVLQNNIRDLALNMPAIYELLPTEYAVLSEGYIENDGIILDNEETKNFIKDLARFEKDEESSGTNKLLYQNALDSQSALISEKGHIISDDRFDVYMIAGFNCVTVTKIVEENNLFLKTDKTYFGDGTVSCESAAFYNGELFDNPVYFVDGVDHRSLVKDSDTLELITSIIDKDGQINKDDYNNKKIVDYEDITLRKD